MVTSFGNRVKNMHFELNDSLIKIDEIPFIPLPNIDNTIEFKEEPIETGKFDRKIGLIFENDEFNNIVNQLEIAVLSCQRVEQKSIALLLDFHKHLIVVNDNALYKLF